MKLHYKLRHKILGVLIEKENEFGEDVTFNNPLMSLKEISSKLSGYDTDTIYQNLQYLTSVNEIHCSSEGRESKFRIVAEGKYPYFESAYLQSGTSQYWNSIYDKIKTISTFVILIIAILTFIMNLFITLDLRSKLRDLKRKTILLETKINETQLLRETRLRTKPAMHNSSLK